jgi:acetyl-CoA carboxylase biotin carboxyl carrier protein
MGGPLMAEKRRERLQKSALRALDAAREAARRARGGVAAPQPSSGISPAKPSTPPVERFTTERRTAERSEPRPVIQTTPPRPRRGQPRLNAQPPELRIPRQTVEQAPLTSDEADLVELIDRLAAVADGSGLAEIELSSGGTRVVVRSRAAVAGAQIILNSGAPAATASAAPTAAPNAAPSSAAPAAAAAASAAPSGVFVNAPLTGIFYAAATPGADPMIAVGQTISVGQPIGLIEAMKLFNEIKSDKAGRVVRIVAENGRLVKSKSPIIELES